MSRKRKQFTTVITMVAVPLPPEKEYLWRECWRTIGEIYEKMNALQTGQEAERVQERDTTQ